MPTALVTGASAGIGLELAREFARRGHDLVLVARREDKLRALATEIESGHAGLTVRVVAADLSRPEAPQEIFRQLAGVSIDALANNAGFADYGLFAAADPASMQDMLAVNVLALTSLTRLFLPDMLARRRGCILNVASTAAFFPGPFMAVYYASKAYVLSFSEGLAEELKDSGVTVTCLCPGPTSSEFQKRAEMTGSRLMQSVMMDAKTVAEEGVAAALAGKFMVVPGRRNRLNVLAARILPRARLAKIIRDVQGPR